MTQLSDITSSAVSGISDFSQSVSSTITDWVGDLGGITVKLGGIQFADMEVPEKIS